MRWLSGCATAAVVTFIACGSLWAASDPPGIKWVNAPKMHGVEGKALYDAYCAACHGPTGKGNGPAAKFLEVPVPDLSAIAQRDGQFNVAHVKYHILDQAAVSAVMPDWDEILRWNYSHNGELALLATVNLTRHVQSLQASHAAR